ncbi:hypothetical protein [Microscilla marina]|uniref:Hydrolase, alpha/beta fold family n=1 Tax=Microscilla marina ATCC 23134 TaxID=313606 RepID=A1ZGH7_MICM2|nr:hypothetical protein [Microscilla marina]EAY30594.1 hydrolase, alpha/beta fold family [Microscilla marina ATCC 23134]
MHAPSSQKQFGIFKVLDNNTSVEMNGEVNSQSLTNFTSLTTAYPNITIIHIKTCDGSSDDDVNLQLSALVHKKKINTHIVDGGLVASGGTDFFLAGVERSKGSNTKIGVHSWAGNDQEATDFPEGHIEHRKYIEYYVSVGFSQTQAKSFYYFTINAAPASSIHWMTDAEIQQYSLLTKISR